MANSVESSNTQLLRAISTGLVRIKLTLSVSAKLLKLLFSRKSTTTPAKTTHAVIIASDFLPSIHGGIYRPLSWLRYAIEHNVNLKLLTNQPKRLNKVGEKLILDHGIEARLCYCDEADYQLFSRPARLWLARPEFMLAALDRLERIHQEQPINLVLATGPDFSSFAIAVIFAKKHNIRCHLDYRDEWTLSPFAFSEATALSRFLENACVNLADSISMTTQSQLLHFQQHFGSKNLYLKQNGCDDFPLVQAVHAHTAAPSIRICHSGSIGGHNSLETVVAFFTLLQQQIAKTGILLDLQFCGFIAEAQLALLNKVTAFKINTLGQLSPEQAFSHTADADICLLLIDERYDRYLPGKLFSYIATGKPILILGASHSTEIAQMCSQYAVSHYFVDIKSPDVVACANFLKDAHHQQTSPEQLQRFRAQMDRQTLAKDFFNIFGQR